MVNQVPEIKEEENINVHAPTIPSKKDVKKDVAIVPPGKLIFWAFGTGWYRILPLEKLQLITLG